MKEETIDWVADVTGDVPAAELPATWEEHWRGMPEFVQGKVEPFATITVRFETEADLKDFAAAIKQRLSKKTRSIWHPYKPHRLPNKKVYRAK